MRDPLPRSPDPAADATPDAAHQTHPARQSTSNLLQYEHYFSSGSYDRRYPAPNARMLRLARTLLPPAGHLIDFGCGSGRYLLALRERARLVAGFDICHAALGCLRHNVMAHPRGVPVHILGPDPESLERHVARHGGADLVLCLFGVLSHVEGRRARREMLRRLAGLLRPGTGRILLSVPNRHRRFRREQRLAEPGTEEIRYLRQVEGGTIELSYRLFDPESLAEELAEAGLEIERIGAESLLPEAQVAGSRHLRGLDARIAPHIPARLGYGLAAVVRPCATAPEGTAT
ncbi:methyltransferase domain-containing protein [Rhodobacteraceae bacterium DSL-40]|uniref:class I SAM-dependent methyltransferase n=1 Tax=Amaricoccus sp. B4 TaxID=3368557 RepID=UPI0013A6EE54